MGRAGAGRENPEVPEKFISVDEAKALLDEDDPGRHQKSYPPAVTAVRRP